MLQLKMNELSIEKIFEDRQIDEKWLNASRADFLPATMLFNMERALTLIKTHIDKKWVIVVDSDCDGICSSAIAYMGLTRLGATNVELIKFDGKTHGIEGQVDKIPACDVLLLPDAGTNDVAACKTLFDNGTKILILDHHEVEVENPYAQIVNPHQAACQYPNKSLCGTTVTWKVFNELVDMMDTLDLCAVATVGDKMALSPLENIGFVREGMANIVNPYLLAHFSNDERLADKSLDAGIIGWYLAPLINACIRVGEVEDMLGIVNAMAGVVDGNETISHLLKMRNAQNRKINACLPTIVLNTIDDAPIVICERPPSLPKSMTGLVANKLVNHYNKPVLLGSINEHGYFAGSARNINNAAFGLKETLAETALMDFVAGHSNAHGFGMSAENIAALKEALADLNVQEQNIVIDGLLNTVDDVEQFLWQVLEVNGWFECDKDPVKLGVVVDAISEFTTMKDKHCKFMWHGIPVIMWNTTEPPQVGDVLVVQPSVNTWMGRQSLQLISQAVVKI